MNKIIKIIFIGLVVGLLILVIIVFVWWQFFRVSPPTNENLNENINANENVNQAVNVNAIPTNLNQNWNVNVSNTNTTETKTEADLKRIALSFAERFGSFSNQSNYENIENLKVYMSKSMSRWADQFIAEVRAKNPDTSIYYGITTKALSSKTLEFDESKGKASFMISTQRREATGSSSNARVYYQDIKISFIQEGGVWKVNEARWQ